MDWSWTSSESTAESESGSAASDSKSDSDLNACSDLESDAVTDRGRLGVKVKLATDLVGLRI
jgi:hypothetical protein